MQFSLPPSFLDEIRSELFGIDLFISLEGLISLDRPKAADFVLTKGVELDELVARDISPEILKDEPTALTMLTKLRERLVAALGSFEDAIASLREN
jgi:hypothetical protein